MLIENIKFSVPTINIIRIMQSLGLRPRLFSISHNSHYVKSEMFNLKIFLVLYKNLID